MNAHSKHDKGDIIMSVVPEIKSPLEEKIVVKPMHIKDRAGMARVMH